MNVQPIPAFLAMIMVTALVAFVVANIWMPESIEPGVFKTTLYTIGVVAGGSVALSVLTFPTRRMPREDAKWSKCRSLPEARTQVD
jgi:hypothetical protein